MSDSQRKWKKISGKIVYKNPWISIHEDKVSRPDGSEGIYGYLEKPVGVFIVAYNDKTKSVLFIKQHRYPINKVIIEIPAGIAVGGDYLSEARRELKEETGVSAKEWKHLGSFFVAPGHESTRIEVFLATGFDKQEMKTNGQEADEAIVEIIDIKVSDLKEKILAGEIECGITLAALNLFLCQDSQN